MAEFTKGEWTATSSDGQVGVINKQCLYRIADCRKSGLSDEENSANAHLIAAAPEMYEALKYARRFLNPKDQDVDFIDKALNKAEGK